MLKYGRFYRISFPFRFISVVRGLLEVRAGLRYGQGKKKDMTKQIRA